MEKTHIFTVEVTIIDKKGCLVVDNDMFKQELKDAVKADDVVIAKHQVFELEKEVADENPKKHIKEYFIDFMNEKHSDYFGGKKEFVLVNQKGKAKCIVLDDKVVCSSDFIIKDFTEVLAAIDIVKRNNSTAFLEQLMNGAKIIAEFNEWCSHKGIEI